jgi:hypothetical protein
MTAAEDQAQEGSFEGSRCVAGPVGFWGLATICRVNEDGTFIVEFDTKEMILMRFWHGVTRLEMSFNDRGAWDHVFRTITNGRSTMARADFGTTFRRLGYAGDEASLDKFWGNTCGKLFGVGSAEAANLELDAGQAYQLFLEAGVSSKRFADLETGGKPGPAYYKMYWNQTRMGGRDPGDLAREVTLEDAFAAIGVNAELEDPDAVAFLKDIETENKVILPGTLKRFLSRTGVVPAVHDCHPNNPDLVPLGPQEWKLRRPGKQATELTHAVTILTPHQGDFVWAAAFNSGDQDARIYLAGDDDDENQPWVLTAPTLGLFFWDLAQTGLAWYQHTKHKGGKPVRRTDIGLVPAG